MKSQIRPTLVSLLLLTILTGMVYPLLVTGMAQVLFPRQAHGSLIVKDGQIVGSALIGQAFDAPKYFWGRPSATGTYPYNAFNAENLTASAGSNFGPLNPTLIAQVQSRLAALKKADPHSVKPIPVDLVTASASGLDPHISPAAAAYQLDRVARARGLDPAVVQQLIDQHTQGRDLGLLGESRVNVLELNLALDDLAAP